MPSKLLPGLLESGHLGPAGGTTGVPEVYYYRASTGFLGQPELTAVEESYLKVGRPFCPQASYQGTQGQYRDPNKQ
jgi:hypothetical protein